jgi:hypothetical protein
VCVCSAMQHRLFYGRATCLLLNKKKLKER